jgi:hypothetical protein
VRTTRRPEQHRPRRSPRPIDPESGAGIGATDRTYTPTLADVGHRLSVRVTATNDAHLRVSVGSKGHAYRTV